MTCLINGIGHHLRWGVRNGELGRSSHATEVTMTEEIALQEAFRLAMRHLASTVSIISVQSGSMRHGTTATSMTSLSMDPPSVLVCINKTSRLHMLLHKEDRFCVNILHTDNMQTSEVFSMPLPADERFCSGEWD